jgi:hypothetical protein
MRIGKVTKVVVKPDVIPVQLPKHKRVKLYPYPIFNWPQPKEPVSVPKKSQPAAL